MGCNIMYSGVQVPELQRKLLLPFYPSLSIEAASSSENLLPTYQPHDIMLEMTEISTCILSCKTGIFTDVLLKIRVCRDVNAVSSGS
jgi:hypothetical protein